MSKQNNFIQTGAQRANDSSRVGAVAIVPRHQRAGTMGQHRVVMVVYLAVALWTHPHEIVGVTVTVIYLHDGEPAFCHLRVGVLFGSGKF